MIEDQRMDQRMMTEKYRWQKSDIMNVIAEVFHTNTDKIALISVLKEGMTNQSILFSVDDEKYIIRNPGEGTDQLINHAQEEEVYQTIKGLGYCDDPVFIDPQRGYKITRYLSGIRMCRRNDLSDLTRCMEKLRSFHEQKLTVQHTFDLFENIDFYESLWKNRPSVYGDYTETKAHVFSLKPLIDSIEKDNCLTHIDAVPDNFLFYRKEGDEQEDLQLIDWEYAGMQDPHVDIAMFCIYSLYNRDQVDRLIDIYFRGACSPMIRKKIYAYISVCGLLWSNWCEFKRNLGVEFGEYAIRQYRFAKDYYQYLVNENVLDISGGEISE